MYTWKTIIYLFIGFLLSVISSNAAIVISLVETDGDILGTMSGSVNMAALTDPDGDSPVSGSAYISNSVVVRVGGSGAYELWGGGTVVGDGYNYISTSIGSADSSSGDIAGMYMISHVNYVYLPDNYVSGTELYGTSTWQNTTLADMGVDNGDIASITWGSGSTADSISITASIAAVPEVSTYTLVLSLFSGIFILYRRKFNSR